MKHWKAYIKFYQPNGLLVQREQTVAAQTQYDAVNEFQRRYGNDCIIGWIKETKLYGFPSVM